MEESAYNNLLILNRSSRNGKNDLKNYHWLVKPADRIRFAKGNFSGQYYDNGFLRLRQTILPGSVFTVANRPYVELNHAAILEGFLSQIRVSDLFREQAAVANPKEALELEDPDGSKATLLEQVICQVCLEPSFSPSYVCKNGHNLCGRCKSRMSCADLECPTCGFASFDQPSSINSAIADALEFKCRYSLYGCQGKIRGSEVVRHTEKDCNFRPFKCYFCPDIVHAPIFIGHVISKHIDEVPYILKAPGLPSKFLCEVPMEEVIERSRDHTVTTADDKMRICCFGVKTDGLFFLLEIQLMYGNFGWAVAFLGPSSECGKYVAEITVVTEYDVGRGRPTERVTDVFTNQPVTSCQEDVRNILDNIKNTSYPDGMARKDFSQYGGAGRYHSTLEVKIRRSNSD